MPARSRLGVGLVGLGYAADFHLPAVLSLPEVRLVAVTDRDRARLDAHAGRHPGRAFRDYRALVDHPEVDIVGILTPPTSHLEIALAAMAAGKHILIEKPITATLEEADRLLAASSRSSSKICVAYVLRFMRQIRRMRALIRAGELGEIEILRCLASTPEMLSPLAPSHRRDRTQGGGSIIELGVHHYDLWAHLLDSRVADVSALSRSIHMHDQSTVVAARMSCGTLASTCVSLGAADQYQVDALGSRARASASLFRYDGFEMVAAGRSSRQARLRMERLLAGVRELPNALRVRAHGGTFRDSFRELWKHLVESIAADTAPEPGLRAGRDSLAAAIASSRASLTGETVAVAGA